MGDAFKAYKKVKTEERSIKEPQRMRYAANEISKVWTKYHINGDKIIIRLPLGTITFYPFTGWFCGQKPYGKIKGRGIKNLMKEIVGIVQPQICRGEK